MLFMWMSAMTMVSAVGTTKTSTNIDMAAATIMTEMQ